MSHTLTHLLGHQILAELHECKKELLDDVKKIKQIMVDAALVAKAEIQLILRRLVNIM